MITGTLNVRGSPFSQRSTSTPSSQGILMSRSRIQGVRPNWSGFHSASSASWPSEKRRNPLSSPARRRFRSTSAAWPSSSSTRTMMGSLMGASPLGSLLRDLGAQGVDDAVQHLGDLDLLPLIAHPAGAGQPQQGVDEAPGAGDGRLDEVHRLLDVPLDGFEQAADLRRQLDG